MSEIIGKAIMRAACLVTWEGNYREGWEVCVKGGNLWREAVEGTSGGKLWREHLDGAVEGTSEGKL